MSDNHEKQNFINQLIKDLDVTHDDVNAVMYGINPPHYDQRHTRLIQAMSKDGEGVVFCLVWKGAPSPHVLRNTPVYYSFGQILEGLNLHLYKNGYTSRLLVSHRFLIDDDYVESLFLQHPNAGLINLLYLPQNMKRLCIQHQRPIVYIDHPTEANMTDEYLVSMSLNSVIEDAVAYLFQLGHRRIAFIKGPQNKQTAVDRFNGYIHGLERVGIEFDEQLVANGNWHEPAGISAVEAFLVLVPPPTAIISSNDLMAIGAMQAIHERNLKIPHDISVMGFDDIAAASMTTPPLTTVRTPMTSLGAKAGEYIIKLLEGESPSPKHVYLPVEIVYRASTGPAPSGDTIN